MNALLVLTAFLIAAAHFTLADDNSGESFEARRRKDTCGHLCDEPDNDSGEGVSDATPATPATEGPSSGSGSGAPPPGQCICTPPEGSGSGSGSHHFHSHCILVEAFYNLSITLTIEQQEFFLVWIQHIEDTILFDFSLTSEQKFIKVAYSLKAFFSIHYDIEIAIGYEFIAGWGKIVDLLSVSIDINADFAESLIVLDGEDDCELFQALRNATAGDSEKEAAVEIIIVKIREILIKCSCSYEEKVTKIFLIFESFFEEHAEWEEFFLSIKIEGFGSLEEYIDVVKVYWRISNLKIVIGGDAETCVLIKALEEASGNSSFSVSVRTQIGQLRAKLLAFFQTETDVFIRLQYVSAQSYQFFKLARFIEKFVSRCSLSSWGSYYDLIFCATFYHNHGWNHGGQTTEAAVATTEAAEGTTGAAVGQCSARGGLITIVVSSNSTVFTDSINAAYNIWSRTDKANFASYKKRIESAIWGSEFVTVESKLTQITTILTGYAPQGSTQEETVMSIQIEKWGTVKHFCDCQSA